MRLIGPRINSSHPPGRPWRLALASALLYLTSCSPALEGKKPQGGAAPTTPAASTTDLNAAAASLPDNAFVVSVGDPGCDRFNNINRPCAAVTICVAGTKQCQTIDSIIVDTGSNGLRLFASEVSLPLPLVSSGSGELAECAVYGGQTSQWGPVAYADVVLGRELAPKVPIQLINAGYAAAPSQCSSGKTTPAVRPADVHYKGVLGIGFRSVDCGDACRLYDANHRYFQCQGGNCKETATSVQVQNPVSLLPKDNNGIIFKLPAVPDTGAESVAGVVMLGIDTQSNNSSSAAKPYPIDVTGGISSIVYVEGSQPIRAFIDSGSSYYYLPTGSSLPACQSSNGFLCPHTPQHLIASNIDALGNTGSPLPFVVANADQLLASSHRAFNSLAKDATSVSNFTSSFDWGLPFFFGRSVYVGIDATTSSLGKGPYWAY